MSVEQMDDHKAFCCDCGSVHFNILKSAKIECAKCEVRFGEWHKNEPSTLMVIGSKDGEGWHTRYKIANRICVSNEGVMMVHVEEES